MKSSQSGFTLVEIAIVLVIIGLLLGGILKGQEMINNAKIKNMINESKAVTAAYYAYQDRYRAIPGDDSAANTRFNGAVAGGGNGAIAGNFNATAAPAVGAESNNFWQHTRMSGLMTGIATATAALPPTSSVGGVIGVENAAFGISGSVVCESIVPMAMAQSMDAQIDDGVATTGSFRAGAAGTVATTNTGTAFDVTNPGGTVTVCSQI